MLTEHWTMSQQDRQISEAIEKEKFRLRNFIRRRVADESDAEDVLQDVFYELIEAYRSMKHIEQVTAWLFAVARNRITDLFRKRRRESTAGEPAVSAEESEKIGWVDLLPSPDAGPEAAYLRSLLIEELDAALEELPQAQRDVFIGHALIGYSFKELAEQTGESVNTLLSRKHYAVLHLRERLESVYKEFRKK